jgi:hypothetical protein
LTGTRQAAAGTLPLFLIGALMAVFVALLLYLVWTAVV